MNKIEYQNYIKWKKWLENGNEFFSINQLESSEYEMEFRASKIKIKNMRVLEIGYGSGKLLRFLSDNGCTIYGLEIQMELIKEAEALGLSVATNINNFSDTFDLIIGFDVLEHLTIDQLQEFFYESQNKLTKNGKMLFRFPNADSYAGMAAQNGDYTHLTSIGKSKLQQIIEPYGLEIESFQGAIEYPIRPIRRFIHYIFRSLLIKLIGFNRPYFFSGNVVAVIKRKV